eukprot:scaffold13232_cov61-Phaeocystis_antarctica.AAC.2
MPRSLPPHAPLSTTHAPLSKPPCPALCHPRWAARSRRRTGARSGPRSTVTASRCTSSAPARTRAAALDCAYRWPRCARRRRPKPATQPATLGAPACNPRCPNLQP